LDTAEVSALNALVDAQSLLDPDVSVESQRFGGFLAWDTCFRDLIDHPRILPYLKELLGLALRLDHAYGIKMRAGSPSLNLHGGADARDAGLDGAAPPPRAALQVLAGAPDLGPSQLRRGGAGPGHGAAAPDPGAALRLQAPTAGVKSRFHASRADRRAAWLQR